LRRFRGTYPKADLNHIAAGCYCSVNGLIKTGKIRTFVESFIYFMRFTPLHILIFFIPVFCPCLFKSQGKGLDFCSVSGKLEINWGTSLKDQGCFLEFTQQDSQNDGSTSVGIICKASRTLCYSYRFFYKNNKHLQKISLSLHQLYCAYLN
jgi:hypothetical protein